MKSLSSAEGLPVLELVTSSTLDPPSAITLVATFSMWTWAIHSDRGICWESWALSQGVRTGSSYKLLNGYANWKLKIKNEDGWVDSEPLPGKLWKFCKPHSSRCIHWSVNQSDGLIQNSGGSLFQSLFEKLGFVVIVAWLHLRLLGSIDLSFPIWMLCRPLHSFQHIAGHLIFECQLGLAVSSLP